jgi:hypothetical protein
MENLLERREDLRGADQSFGKLKRGGGGREHCASASVLKKPKAATAFLQTKPISRNPIALQTVARSPSAIS